MKLKVFELPADKYNGAKIIIMDDTDNDVALMDWCNSSVKYEDRLNLARRLVELYNYYEADLTK